MEAEDKNMRKISVIIPVYNTYKELPRCLDSICGQTYKNLEIICVDDGSSDGSEQIVDEYAGRDSRILAIHQPNAGESAARNTGLRAASGDYIAFVDCDDWLDIDMYQDMMEAVQEDNLDLAACGYVMEYDGYSKAAENERSVSPEVFGRTELFRYVYVRDQYRAVTSWIWCKLFRRGLIYGENGFDGFDERVRFGADLLFFQKAACKADRIRYLDRAYYHYYQRSTSTSHTQKLDIAYEIIDVYQRMIAYFLDNHLEEDIVPWLQRFAAYRATLVSEQSIAQGDRDMLEKTQAVMRQYKEVYMLTNAQYPDRLERFERLLEARI